jgi:hypothetical protein
MSWISQTLYHLHLAKRGFGAPDAAQIEASLEKHKTLVTTEVEVPGYLYEVSRAFARDWAKRYTSVKCVNNIHLTFGSGACLEITREKGGRGEYCRKLLNDFLNSAVLLQLPRNCNYYNLWGEVAISTEMIVLYGFEDGGVVYYPSTALYAYNGRFPNDQVLMRDLLFHEMVLSEELLLPDLAADFESPLGLMFDLFFRDPKLDPDRIIRQKLGNYDYRATAVEDRACKARTITIESAKRGTLGHLLRTYMYALLEKDPNCVLSSDKAEGSLSRLFKKVGQGRKDYRFLSLDLSCATDTFSQLICRGLLNGIIDSVRAINLPLWKQFCVLKQDVASNSLIYYPGLKDKPIVKQVRGILMGTPESWTILNLYLEFFDRLSEKTWELVQDSSRLESWSDPVIQMASDRLLPIKDTPGVCKERCGDDEVKYGPKGPLQHFVKLLKLSGAVPSVGTNCISKTTCVFTETIARIYPGKGLYWIDILRIVGLVDAKGLNRLPKLKEVPRLWFRGLAYTSALKWWNANEWQRIGAKAIKLWGHWLMVKFLADVHRLGLQPYLPQRFGGLSLPHPGGRELSHIPTRYRQVLQYVIRDDVRPDAFFERESLNIWANGDSSDLSEEADRLSKHLIWALFGEDRRIQSAEQWQDCYPTADSKRIGGEPGQKVWIHLGTLRTILGSTLPLNDISIMIIRQWCQEYGMVPIGTFWKEYTGNLRNSLYLTKRSFSIHSPAHTLAAKARQFHKKMAELYSKAKSYPPISTKLSLDDLEKRVTWLDNFILVRKSVYRSIDVLEQRPGPYVGLERINFG